MCRTRVAHRDRRALGTQLAERKAELLAEIEPQA